MKNRKSVIGNWKSLACCLMPFACCLVSSCKSIQQGPELTEPSIHAIWESQLGTYHWKFIMLEDGTLSEIVRPDNVTLNVSEGGALNEGPDFSALYILGPCYWTFEEEGNILTSSITLESYTVKFQDYESTSHIVDEFSGPIVGDRWNAMWKCTTIYDQGNIKQVTDPRKIVFTKKSEN